MADELYLETMKEKKLIGPFTPDHREGQTRTMSDYIQERASSIPAGKQIKKEDGETKRKLDGERTKEDGEGKREDGEEKRGERKKGDGERKGEEKREEEREGERKGEEKRGEEGEREGAGEENRGEEGEREGQREENRGEEGEAEEEERGGNGKMRITVLATVAVLVISSPFLLIFSPILIPAGLILGSVMAGFLVVAGIALAGAHMAAWFYHVITDMKERGGQSEEVERERDEEREREEEKEEEMEKEKEKKKKEKLKEKENKEKEKEMKEKEEEGISSSSSSGSLLISIMSLIKATRTSLATAGPFLWMMRITLLSTIGALVIASPLLLIFSPILIPAALIIGATIASFAVAASMALAGVHMLAWSYHVIRDIKRKNIGGDYINE